MELSGTGVREVGRRTNSCLCIFVRGEKRLTGKRGRGGKGETKPSHTLSIVVIIFSKRSRWRLRSSWMENPVAMTESAVLDADVTCCRSAWIALSTLLRSPALFLDLVTSMNRSRCSFRTRIFD